MRYLIVTLCFMCGLNTLTAQNGTNINVAILGDSNTWIGKDDCSNPRGWNKWFKDKMQPVSCRSYARSGATWTHTTATKANTVEETSVLGDDNVIYNQVLRLSDAVIDGNQPLPDVILIMCGTNDVWFKDKRPHLFDQLPDQAFAENPQGIIMTPVNEILTLAMAVRFNVELLQSAFPEAQIVLLTPMQSTAIPLDDINWAGDVIEACGHRLGCAVIRMDEGGCVSQAREQRKKTYTTDGTHTNEAGARRNGIFIANQLKSILEY